MKLVQLLSVASLFAVLPFSLGCGDDDNVVGTGSNNAVSSLEITTGIDTMQKGESMQFTAIARYADGTSKDVSDDSGTTWNTSDAENATVSETGMVTAVDEGLVDIEASYEGETAEESFLVMP